MSDILQYVDLALRKDWKGRRSSARIDAKGRRCISGDFREGSDIFFGLHPNKRVVDKCVAPLHMHDYIEIVYVRQGTLHHCVEGVRSQAGAGSLLLLNSDAQHQPWVTGADDIVVNLGVNLSRMQKILGGVTERSGRQLSDFIDALFDRRTGKRRPCLCLRQSESIDALMNEMFCEYYCEDEFADKILLTDLVRLMIELCRYRDDGPEPAPDRDDVDGVIRAIQAYIDERYATLTMEELSAHFGYSPRHMRRLLRRVSDEGLPEMLNRIRIEKACAYIDQCDMPTEEIMRRTGFTDAGYFYRVFQRIAGMRIADYRRREPPRP